MKRGKFIVIDGTDGSGKKTQSDLLIASLKRKGYKTAYYDFPQYGKTFFGDITGEYLNGGFGDADDVSPYLSSLLYAGDRWQAKEGIVKDLAQGKIVISNRYTSSNMAFQTAKLKNKLEKNAYLEWIQKLEFEVYGIPRPDQILYLYVPHRIGQAMVDQKKTRNYTNLKRDIHENNASLLERAEKEYLSLSKKFSEWKVIDCCKDQKILSIESIHNKVWQEIDL